MHLKPISRELRRRLYGRSKKRLVVDDKYSWNEITACTARSRVSLQCKGSSAMVMLQRMLRRTFVGLLLACCLYI